MQSVKQGWGEDGRESTRCQDQAINSVYLSHAMLDGPSQILLPTALAA